jgi:hypothetical protein
MATDLPPLPPSTPPEPFNFGQWFARLGISGKLLLFGAVAGIISCMLPAFTVSVSGGFAAIGGGNVRRSTLVVEDWRGIVGLLGFVGAILFCFLLYSPKGLPNKALAWVPIGIGVVVVLMSLLLLMAALRGSQSAGIPGVAEISASPGIGSFLYLITAIAITAGGVLKAKEERLF